MRSMDIEVKMLNIEDPNGEPQTWSPRDRVMAAHILYSKKNEKDFNIQIGNMYCKDGGKSRAAGKLPEGRTMQYVPYESTNVITQTPKHKAKLLKKQTNASVASRSTPLFSFLRS